jgi:Mg2+-importing ATPase
MNLLNTSFNISRGIIGRTAAGWSNPNAKMASALLDASDRKTGSVLYTRGAESEGLTPAQVRGRLKTYGPNIVARELPISWALMLLGNFKNPFILVLLLIGTVSAWTGDIRGALVVSVMVAVSVVMRFLQEYRSSRAAEALRAMVQTTATVIRRFIRIEAAEVLATPHVGRRVRPVQWPRAHACRQRGRRRDLRDLHRGQPGRRYRRVFERSADRGSRRGA